MVHVRAEFAFSGTHGRVPAMVGILMAHVGREFAGSRALRPHVYRREACPVHFCPQFTGPPRTGGRRVPRGAFRYSSGPSFVQPCKLAAGVYRRVASLYSWGPSLRRPCKLGAGVYPGLRPPPHAPGSSLRNRANWGRVRTRGAGALARTRHDLARSCKLAADVCRQPAWHEAPAARYPSTAGATPVARISSRAASSSTGTPSCCAFFSFEPAASPATT